MIHELALTQTLPPTVYEAVENQGPNRIYQGCPNQGKKQKRKKSCGTKMVSSVGIVFFVV